MEKSENVGDEPKRRYHSFATHSEIWPQGIYKVFHQSYAVVEYNYKTKKLTIVDSSQSVPYKSSYGYTHRPPKWSSVKWHLNNWLPLGIKVVAHKGTSDRWLHIEGQEPKRFRGQITIKYRGIL
jgi:hypothetical protein